MPTIEIASLNSSKLDLDPAAFKVAIIQEGTLESHRSVSYDFLIKQPGVIVHIGNPDLQSTTGGGFSAGQIIDWAFEEGEIVIPQSETTQTVDLGSNQQFRFQLLKEYKGDIDRILKIALEKANYEILYTITDFWQLHDRIGLVFNSLYKMHGE